MGAPPCSKEEWDGSSLIGRLFSLLAGCLQLEAKYCSASKARIDSGREIPQINPSLYAIKAVYGMEESKTQNTGTASCHGIVGQLARNWQSWSKDRVAYQQRNPFSNGNQVTLRTEKGDPAYGRPPEGSKTEQRGKDAHAHIGKEVEELCLVIRNTGKREQDGQVRITFKQLFDKYVTISNKLVGVLLRARKNGLVDFEGEMLWQGKDDSVVITLFEQDKDYPATS